jgi:hypothetical protein
MIGPGIRPLPHVENFSVLLCDLIERLEAKNLILYISIPAIKDSCMRKYILGEERESSIIILQSCVCESLDRELRADFQRFDLAKHKTSVCDDSGASVPYYKLLDCPVHGIVL